MRKALIAAALVCIPVAAWSADSGLQWAYPVAPPNPPPSDVTYTAVGAPASMKLTMTQINDAYSPPDWFPNEHAPLPETVSHGRAPHVRACMQCHLPNGNGHPESASLSGLTPNYIIEQMHDFRDGNRASVRATAMIEMAKDIKEDELKAAADYFAAISPSQQKWIRVVESKTAPASHVGSGGMLFKNDGNATVPVPQGTIYEMAENAQGAELRDQHFGFVDYVPVGSIKSGEALATSSTKTIQCSICHGADYKGLADVPRLAGRSAYYLIRQLNDIKTGTRKGQSVALMQPVVAKLSDADMVNLVAYMASLQP